MAAATGRRGAHTADSRATSHQLLDSAHDSHLQHRMTDDEEQVRRFARHVHACLGCAATVLDFVP